VAFPLESADSSKTREVVRVRTVGNRVNQVIVCSTCDQSDERVYDEQ